MTYDHNFFFLNQQNVIKNQVFAQNRQRPVLQKVQTKAPYIGGTPENTNKDTRATPIRTTPTKINIPLKLTPILTKHLITN
jgi:hypothetical protein